ncbi:hypothetical protein HK100_011292 [Physocladia obscura]|uniref:Scaffold protein Nfu/NifU N-terminal domain-containing protein n=1 Tax=Physocladia obscura TaxID=109957 RepID=A0AAD5T2D2_9FUNG|nr:hypothetical protein HK100_011292 [Physocladia obscura]
MFGRLARLGATGGAGVRLVVGSRGMFIQTTATPNAQALKFSPGAAVVAGSDGTTSVGTVEFTSARAALGRSPLASRLFGVDGVRHVLLGGDFVTVTKDETAEWPLLKPDIYAAIMDHYATGQPAVAAAAAAAAAGSDADANAAAGETDADSDVVALIKELLDSRIRPTIQDDGGDVEFVAFDTATGTVSLRLKGACRSCDSSVITLKNGIENMLMHYVPDVRSVVQAYDELDGISQSEFDKLEKSLKSPLLQ